MYINATFNEISEPIPNGLTNTVSMFESCYNITNVDYNFLKTLKPGADISYMFILACCRRFV